jgi:hypothetical protein
MSNTLIIQWIYMKIWLLLIIKDGGSIYLERVGYTPVSYPPFPPVCLIDVYQVAIRYFNGPH